MTIVVSGCDKTHCAQKICIPRHTWNNLAKKGLEGEVLACRAVDRFSLEKLERRINNLFPLKTC